MNDKIKSFLLNIILGKLFVGSYNFHCSEESKDFILDNELSFKVRVKRHLKIYLKAKVNDNGIFCGEKKRRQFWTGTNYYLDWMMLE